MKKRFIAGVTCPKCGALDTMTVINNELELLYVRECVECGFSDRISTQVNTPKEITTRVTPESVQLKDEHIQVVKFIQNEEDN
ncbi:YheV family putative zinc ribbon protein [Reinekea thalattae]|uniref:YheV family putative metal-binding protein n=1 Tax=Reinekea thalattae TaxID=2593301 RepID=A0A5C8ZC42_9GAMM|nr:YheV family putative zinc ribbon protein [Reinekea thalattae]TXR54733.1 YheV family putative metal-binding protein [Reinekea thalattae]